MSDTFASKGYGDVYADEPRKNTSRECRKVGEAGIYPAYLCRVHTDNFVYLAKQSDGHFAGFAKCMQGHDLDTVYTYSATAESCDKIELYAFGDDIDIYVFYAAQSPAQNLVFGDILTPSTTDGMLMYFAYADGAEFTDTHKHEAHVVDDAITGSTTANKLVRVHI